MEGVRILNEISPMTAGVWLAVGLFLAIGITSLIIVFFEFDKGGRAILILVSLIFFVLAMTLFLTKYNSPMKYEAIIDDTVKLSAFEKKYKIIKKRGDIYVIEERDEE